jgi:hypothetical protein
MTQQTIRPNQPQTLASPERLDQLLRVTTPSGWLTLAALGLLLAAAMVWGVVGSIATTVTGQGILLHGGRVHGVVAPVAGEVSALFVAVGDTVVEGQLVAIVSPPNSLDSAEVTRVTSAYNGRVIELRAERGSIVAPSDTLLSLEASDLPLEAIVYLPTSASANVRPGMAVQVLPANVAKEEYGFLRGEVRSVAAFPSTARGMALTIAHDELVDHFLAAGPPFEIRSGVLCRAAITLGEQRPLSFVLPVLR